MASEFEEASILNIAAPVPNATAAGPFGSNLVSRDYTETGVPVIRGQNLLSRWVGGDFVYVSPEKAAALRTNTARPGDIVFTQRGTLGQVAMVPDGEFPLYVISQSQMKLSIDSTKADASYVYYACTSQHFVRQVLDNAVAAGVPHINLGTLRALTIPLPELTEQERISGLLGALDDRIDLLRQTNATLEAIAQALFRSWFVDFDPVRAKAECREPEGMDAATAALFPSEFEESELGLIPKGWSIRAVGDVTTITRGRSYKSSELADSDTALVTLKSFNRGGGFRRDGFKPYTGPFKPEQEVFEGDCIVAHTDVTQQAELIGRSAVVTRSTLYSRHVASLDVGIVRPKTDELTSIFLSALLSGDRYVSHIKGYTSGTTVLHLSKDGLPGFKFACPSPGLVKAYSDLAFAMFQRQATNIAVQESLAELRDTLLPRLISGKLRLPDAEESIEAAAA